MEAYLGIPQAQLYSIGLWCGTDQGSQIKSTSGWYSVGNGTNSTGFSAVSAGQVGGWLNYGSLGWEAIFQTSI